jgi:transposase InsO family protein
VWAVDFSDAGVDVEGGFDQLLLVRDLATGFTLLALPCRGQDAATVRAAFAALFARHGPPLVLKSDNGSPFVAELMAELLAQHQVIFLRSPPGTPAFNGACEAGCGSIKTRAHHIAAARGRETCWSLDDVAAARTSANETPASADTSSTPAHRWERRSALGVDLRDKLRAEVAARTVEELALRGLHPVHPFEDALAQDVARVAIAGALRACSLLSSHLTTIPARRGPRRSDKGMSEEAEIL